jgi:hypothetical protein
MSIPTREESDRVDWQSAGEALWARAQELAGSNATGADLQLAFQQARAERPDLADLYDRKQLAPPKPARVNSVAVAPPSPRDDAGGIVRTSPDRYETWAMKDAHGNLVVGSTEPGVPATLVLRDPTLAEARERIGRRMTELQDAGVEVHEAQRKARAELLLEARVYDGV